MPLPIFSLLVLVLLSLPSAGGVLAQGNSHKDKGFRYEKGGPPAWAPAHGYRRKGGEDDHDKKKHKAKQHKKDKKWKHKEEELKRREQAQKRREEAYKRKRYPSDKDRDADRKQRQPTLKKRRTNEQEPKKPVSIFEKGKAEVEEKIEDIQQKERRQQEEVGKRVPEKKEGDWSSGSGW